MTKIKDLPEFSRPREKFFELGSDGLSDQELLAILIRTGYKGKSALEVARRILSSHSLADLARMPLADLAKIKGLGRAKACVIAAALSLGVRSSGKKILAAINSPADVFMLVNDLKTKKKEYLVALYLNAKKELIKRVTISVGTLTKNLVHPREVFAPALKCHAAGLILVHNHPSGSADPSNQDLSITKRILESSRLLGIELVDHIIVSSTGFFSLRESRLWP